MLGLLTTSQAQLRTLTLLLPGLSVQTSFAHDRGDAIHLVTYEGHQYLVHEATHGVLSAAGWKTRGDKLELGEAWMREIVLFGSQIEESKDYPTKSELLPNGNYQFTALVVSMQGREPGRHRTYRRIQITPDAELIYER